MSWRLLQTQARALVRSDGFQSGVPLVFLVLGTAWGLSLMQDGKFVTKKLSRAKGDVADPFAKGEFSTEGSDYETQMRRIEAEREAMLERSQSRAKQDYEIKRIPREGEADRVEALRQERLRKEKEMEEEIRRRDEAFGLLRSNPSSVALAGLNRFQRLQLRLLPEVEAVLESGDPRQVSQLSLTVSDLLGQQ